MYYVPSLLYTLRDGIFCFNIAKETHTHSQMNKYKTYTFIKRHIPHNNKLKLFMPKGDKFFFGCTGNFYCEKNT